MGSVKGCFSTSLLRFVGVHNNDKFGMNPRLLAGDLFYAAVRTVVINNEPYFVGKDVAAALGYADTFGALKKHVDEEDKQNCQNDSFDLLKADGILPLMEREAA